MPLVPAKCTQCGATIEVDNKKDAAVCKYCGCAFIVEKAINNYTTNIINNNNFSGATINVSNQADANNLFQLGLSSYKSGRYEEAYQYFTRTLEIDRKNYNAIFGRGLALARLSTITQTSYDVNLLMAFQNFKDVIDDDNLASCLRSEDLVNFFDEIGNIISDLINLANMCYVPKAMNTQNINVVLGALEVLYNASNFSIDLMDEIRKTPEIYTEEMANVLYKLCIIRIRAIDSLIAEREYSVVWGLRSGIGQVNKVRSPKYKEYLELREVYVKEMLTIFPNKDIPFNIINVNSDNGQIKSNNGCYIATCVYGSYDCPEVWVLRRFRDYKLARTKRGRVFIKVYYAISPRLVKLFGNANWFKALWRRKLNRMVKKYKAEGYDDTPYFDLY